MERLKGENSVTTYKKKIWPMVSGTMAFAIIVVGVCLVYAASVLVTGVSQDLEQFDGQALDYTNVSKEQFYEKEK